MFPLTADLRKLLKAQQAEHDRLKKAGHIVPQVFFKEVSDRRKGPKKPTPIGAFMKTWKAACEADRVPRPNPP